MLNIAVKLLNKDDPNQTKTKLKCPYYYTSTAYQNTLSVRVAGNQFHTPTPPIETQENPD